jgi:hypothetical protein
MNHHLLATHHTVVVKTRTHTQGIAGAEQRDPLSLAELK